ncbi:hypothetical protein F8M41_022233 [Gigaspora margarita]|uniref:Uncharacterized protein n=1 Tax=Gigaspora margarita TaxID=4874 RepID=A0A8H4ETV4_GIGMA|nr:hypothetical protein F8M41_022233 [Gigaspora margarita]
MDNNNTALLLQLLTNPSTLQQTLATIKQSQQQSSPTPETTLLFLRGLLKTQLPKKNGDDGKKIKKPKIEKIFLNYLETIRKAKIKKAYKKGIPAPPKHESSSSKSFAESSLLLTNKQTHLLLYQIENFVKDNTQKPFNTIDIDDNDTQQNSGKNTIEADTIEANDNDT